MNQPWKCPNDLARWIVLHPLSLSLRCSPQMMLPLTCLYQRGTRGILSRVPERDAGCYHPPLCWSGWLHSSWYHYYQRLTASHQRLVCIQMLEENGGRLTKKKKCHTSGLHSVWLKHHPQLWDIKMRQFMTSLHFYMEQSVTIVCQNLSSFWFGKLNKAP